MAPTLSLKLRVAGGFIVLVAGALGVASPLVLRRTHEANVSSTVLLLKAFSAGVVLSLALVHLISDSFANFAELTPGARCARSRRRSGRWPSPTTPHTALVARRALQTRC